MEVRQTTKIALAWDLYCQGVPKSHIAKLVGVHRETVGIWMSGIEGNPQGLGGYLEYYLNCKKTERTKEKLIQFRKREFGACEMIIMIVVARRLKNTSLINMDSVFL